MDEASSNSTRESVLTLMSRRSTLESELAAQLSVLASEGVDMHEPLVDEEDFPRADIDVYKVRHARHNIVRLRNDLKELMREIEQGLHSLHRQSREGVLHPDQIREEEQREKSGALPKVFAKIDVVTPDSPAQIAGLRVGDQIASFGTINFANFSLAKVAELTRQRVGQNLEVQVVRNERLRRFGIVPKQWGGKGLLGCNIVPIEGVKVDR